MRRARIRNYGSRRLGLDLKVRLDVELGKGEVESEG